MKTLLVYPSAVISIPAVNPKERLEKNGPLGALLPSSHPKNTSGNQLMTQRALGNVVFMQADRMSAEAQVTTSTRVLKTPHGHRLFVNVSTVTRVAELNLMFERYSTRSFFLLRVWLKVLKYIYMRFEIMKLDEKVNNYNNLISKSHTWLLIDLILFLYLYYVSIP